MVLDEIDKIILNTLQGNGRTTNSKLSKMVGISAPATLERVKRLENHGVISSFTILVDHEKLGYTITAMVNLTLNLSDLSSVKSIKKKFIALDEVVECYQITGGNDFLLKVISKDMRHYADFINKKLTQIKGIQAMNSSFMIDKVKEKKKFIFDNDKNYELSKKKKIKTGGK
ncbi:MAG: Lrp/AsnC family transcriptional regulator [Desulfobacteraceae bacterium]|nr:Lrp/AsnC family transcriptional regulator [Desulfobacteraceae bacterium]